MYPHIIVNTLVDCQDYEAVDGDNVRGCSGSLSRNLRSITMADPRPPPGGRQSASSHSVSAPQSSRNRIQKAAEDSGHPDIVPLGFRRSCTNCYRRKVKCDRSDPCSNCVGWNLTCQFPDPTRTIRRPRKPAARDAATLLKRLKTLESVVQQWSGSPETTEDDQAKDDAERKLQARTPSIETEPGEDCQSPDCEFGRLMIDQGRNRYVWSSFWAHLTDEVSLFNADCTLYNMV